MTMYLAGTSFLFLRLRAFDNFFLEFTRFFELHRFFTEAFANFCQLDSPHAHSLCCRFIAALHFEKIFAKICEQMCHLIHRINQGHLTISKLWMLKYAP